MAVLPAVFGVLEIRRSRERTALVRLRRGSSFAADRHPGAAVALGDEHVALRDNNLVARDARQVGDLDANNRRVAQRVAEYFQGHIHQSRGEVCSHGRTRVRDRASPHDHERAAGGGPRRAEARPLEAQLAIPQSHQAVVRQPAIQKAHSSLWPKRLGTFERCFKVRRFRRTIW